MYSREAYDRHCATGFSAGDWSRPKPKFHYKTNGDSEVKAEQIASCGVFEKCSHPQVTGVVVQAGIGFRQAVT